MARINSYTRDKSITTEDTLIGSSYEGTGQQGPIYQTQSYKVGDLAKYLNLVFTVDEVNYNLNDMILRIEALENANSNFQDQIDLINNHLNPNFVITTDVDNNISTLKTLGGTTIDPSFTVASFGMWDSVAGQRIQPFAIIDNTVKLKREHLQINWDDIGDKPPIPITTVIYADDANGTNQSLDITGKDYYAFFSGPEALTELNFDPPYLGLNWLKITGEPGDTATRVSLTANTYRIKYEYDGDEYTTVTVTASIQNVPLSEAGLIWYVDGTPQSASPVSDFEFTLPDNLEPAFGEAVTIRAELYRLGVYQNEDDALSIVATKDGTDAIVYVLTNPFSSPPCNSDGEVLDDTFPRANGYFKVWVGGDEVSDQCTFTVSEEVGVDVSIVSNTGYYNVNSLTDDEAYAVFQAFIPKAVAKTPQDQTRTLRYNITKNKAGNEGTPGNPGSPGKTVSVYIEPDKIIYDEYGVLKPGQSITVRADSQGYSAPQYKFYKDDVSLHLYPDSGVTDEWSFTNTYTVPEDFLPSPNTIDRYRVHVRENHLDLNPSVDTDTLYAVQDNYDSITVILDNETTSLTTSYSGNISYQYSNNRIEVLKGSELLTYIQNPSTLQPGQFTVTATGTDITPGAFSGNNTTACLVANATDMEDANGDPVESALITFEVTIYAQPNNIVITKKQVFSKAKQGETGETIIGPKGERTYSAVVWYEDGIATQPTPIPYEARASDNNYIIYDFNDGRLETASQLYDPVTGDIDIVPTGSNAAPVGWQEDAPEPTPGTSDSIYWTSRFHVEEVLDSSNNPTGYGIPVFNAPLRGLVFNQVVTFHSEDDTKGRTQIDGGWIDTFYITSANYDPPNTGATFADKGMLIDLTKGEIISTNLVLTSNADGTGTKTLSINGDGNFTGNLTGASGTFGGVTINSAGISSTNFSILSNGVITSTAGTIGGWNISSSSIYTGTEDTTEYSSNGITISSANGGSIHAENFYIDSQGNAFFRGDITGANFGDHINLATDDIILDRFVIDQTASQLYGTETGGKITFKDVSTSLYGLRRYYDGTFGPTFDDYAIVDGNLNVSGTLSVEGLINQALPSGDMWGSTGYTKLTSDKGGLLIQWVTKVNTDTSSPYNGTTGPWPTPFPNRCIGAVATRVNSSSGSSPGSPPDPPTNTNAVNLSYTEDNYRIEFNNSGTTVFIIAIGY